MNNSGVAELGLYIRKLMKEEERYDVRKRSHRTKSEGKGRQKVLRKTYEPSNNEQSSYSDIYRKAIEAEVSRGK